MSRALTEQDYVDSCLGLSKEGRELLGIPLDSSSSSSSWPPLLSRPPSALEFSRLVARSSPVLIEGCVDDRPALKEWSSTNWLMERMGSAKVNVALTPNGRADDLLLLHQGQDVFALPLEVDMTFKDLASALSSRKEDAPVAYLQSQGSNLTSEPALSPLCDDFAPRSHASSTTASSTRSKDNASLSFLFATQALDKEPEAINLWVGNARAFTSTHRDHYENLFTVVRGVKEFYLWPPAEGWALEETEPLPIYQWSIDGKKSDSDYIAPNALKSSDLVLRPVPSAPKTPWIRPSPLETRTSKRNAPCKRYAQSLPPLRVKVGQGQTLYLPAGWYHAVAQQVDDGQGEGASAGLCIAINQWYESDAAFSDRWAWTQFQRSLGKKLDGTFVKEDEV